MTQLSREESIEFNRLKRAVERYLKKPLPEAQAADPELVDGAGEDVTLAATAKPSYVSLVKLGYVG